ncbi:MAG: alternative ribosome rescue aminoacyl-tRNA hydrolase ArfB, partial [Rhodanobacteraceae bacterium]
MLRITRSIDIPEHELSESFVRASGPGGQHVNRTESAVELRFDIANSPSIPQRLRERLLGRGDRRITQDGVVVIQARRFRDQARNRD